MSQSRIFSLNSRHVRLAHNLVAVGDETRINPPTIGDIEIALPGRNDRPERTECFSTMVAYNPP